MYEAEEGLKEFKKFLKVRFVQADEFRIAREVITHEGLMKLQLYTSTSIFELKHTNVDLS